MATAGVEVPGASGRGRRATSAGDSYYDEAVTGWIGWIGFGGVMLILIGTFHAIAGFVGIFKDGYYVVPKKDLLVSVDYTAWGWTHLGLGVLAIAVGLGLFAGQMWARILGVVFAVVSATVNIAFLNASPVWSTIIIACDVLVIWAITVHGSEMSNMRDS